MIRPKRFLPLVLLAASLSGCSFAANTVGWPTVLTADSEAKKCIEALVTNDKPKLLAQGLTDSKADKVIADAAGRVASKDAKLVLEDFVDSRYYRKYEVPRVKKSPADHDTIEILFTFINRSDSDYAHIVSVEFIETED